MGELIKEVHISGVKIEKEKIGDHYSLAEGNLDLKGCIAALKKAKFKGALIFEIVTKNPLDIAESKNIIGNYNVKHK